MKRRLRKDSVVAVSGCTVPSATAAITNKYCYSSQVLDDNMITVATEHDDTNDDADDLGIPKITVLFVSLHEELPKNYARTTDAEDRCEW